MSDYYEMKIGDLEDEITQLEKQLNALSRENMQLLMMEEAAQKYAKNCKEQLKEALEVIEFYGNEAFNLLNIEQQLLCGYSRGEVIMSDWEWCGKNAIGGKRARKYLENNKAPSNS